MNCDKCGGEATVHEVTIRSGKKVERHLCEQCAKGEGLPVQSQNVSVTQVLSQFIAQQAAGASAPLAGPSPEASRASQCPVCGTTYAQFRHDGLLGCPDCYAAFEIQLGPLLERAHEGGTHHVGKVPRRVAGHAPQPGQGAQRLQRLGPAAGPPPPPAAPRPPAPVAPPPPVPPPDDRPKRIEALQRKLAEAVAAEQYEIAARVRDELRRLTQPASPTGAAPPPVSPPAPRKPGPRKPPGAGPAPGGGGAK